MLRIPLLVLALTTGCTCGPGYEGVTVPQTIDQLVTRNGFVYATGNFRPGPTTRGDASLTVVDAVPMGNAGMILVEIGATALTARRGFVHGWNTNGIDTRTFGTY